jgi:hypothetical protein
MINMVGAAVPESDAVPVETDIAIIPDHIVSMIDSRLRSLISNRSADRPTAVGCWWAAETSTYCPATATLIVTKTPSGRTSGTVCQDGRGLIMRIQLAVDHHRRASAPFFPTASFLWTFQKPSPCLEP